MWSQHEPTISQKLAIEHARVAGACEWIVNCCELEDVALALGQRAGQYVLGILTGMRSANADALAKKEQIPGSTCARPTTPRIGFGITGDGKDIRLLLLG